MTKEQEWLIAIEQYYQQKGNKNGSIVLLPGYQPELCLMLCNHLYMKFYDYRQEEMHFFGHQADTINLDHLDNCLLKQSQSKSIFAHNIEALLCVKTKQERRDWLQSFLAADWPNPVFIAIAVFQDDVQEDHPHVCDFELMRIPRDSLKTAAKITNCMKYDIAGIKSRVY
ncbi:MAG: hypothetical protein LC437_08425 [Thiohalomonas sp.]|nr:hypothetical protein [Thiohalomonas sp.]